jgi:hypothetical protein
MSTVMRAWAAGCFALCLTASPAHANGGCVETTYSGGAAGSLRPQQQTVVRLVSEELELTVDDHNYQADARYTLSNPGPPLKVLYAVPIVSGAQRPRSGPQCAQDEAPEPVAKSVRISVAGGPPVRCAYVSQPNVPNSARPTGLAITGGRLDEVEAKLSGYCVAEVQIPTAKAVELRLTYAAPLFSWSAMSASRGDLCFEVDNMPPPEVSMPCQPDDKACLQERARVIEENAANCARTTPLGSTPSLYYPLGMASTWAGPPPAVSVTVRFASELTWDESASSGLPAGATFKADVLKFGWKAVNLRGADFIVALHPKGKDVNRWEESGTAGRCGPRPRVTARASSTLVDRYSHYEPARAADGDAATAWCVNTPDAGVGEWIEVTWPPGHPSTGTGLFMLPGLGADQRLYRANGRVKRVRYGPCGPQARMMEASLPLADVVEDAMVPVATDFWVQDTAAGACVRLEILEVAPGATSKDVCISELSFGWMCD